MRGRWKRPYSVDRELTSYDELVAFLNYSGEPDAILAFTKRYGPLTVDAATKRATFSFTLKEWRRAQSHLRMLWDSEALVPGQGVPLDPRGTQFPTRAGEVFRRYAGRWSYVASTLERLFWLEVLAAPANRLRKCAHPDCGRYFFANHRREKYCSLPSPCKHLARKRRKLVWWHQKGDPERLRRKAQEQSDEAQSP